MSEILLQVFLKVGPELAKYAGQKALNQPTVQVSSAIQATAKEFPLYANLAEWLSDWCGSSEFFHLHSSLSEGDRVTAEAVMSSFTAFVGTVDPDRAKRCGEEVLTVFLRRMDEQLLGSRGLAIVECRNEDRHEDLKAFVQHSINAAVTSMKQNVLPAYPASSPVADSAARIAEESAADARLDAAKKLLESGRPKAASLILDDVRAGLRPSTSTALRFRLEALDGSKSLHLGDPNSAVRHLRLGIVLDPKNARAKANLSQALALVNESQQALEFSEAAASADPNDAYVAAVYLRRRFESGAFADVHAFASTHQQFLADAHFLRVTAEALYEEGRYEAIIALLADRLKYELPYAPVWEIHGRTLFVLAEARILRERILPWLLPSDVRDELSQAEKALTSAIQLMDATESEPSIAALFVNRAAIASRLGQTNRAEADLDHALATNPNLAEARHGKAVILVQRREYGSAIEHLRRIQPPLPVEMQALLGLAYARVGKLDDAIHTLNGLLAAHDIMPKQRLRCADLLAYAYRTRRDFASAGQVIEEIVRDNPTDPDALFLLAEHKEATGDIDGARRDFELAFNTVADPEKPIFSMDLAAFYLRHEMYADAAKVYQSIAAPSMHPGLRHNYATSLLLSGQQRAAYSFVRRVRFEEGFDASLADIEIGLCERIGDLDEADDLMSKLQDHAPDLKGQIFVRRATNLYRRGKKDAASEMIQQVSRADLPPAPDVLMQVAKLRNFLDLDGCLDHAYDAWVLGRSRPEIALLYLGLSLERQRKDRHFLEPQVADVGCRIQSRSRR